MDRLDDDDDDKGDDEIGRREDGETLSVTCEDAVVEASSTDDDGAKATTPLELPVEGDITDPNVEDAIFHDCARTSRSRS